MPADQEVPRVPGSPSLYRKVAEDIKTAIAAGGYAAGTRLPSEHELAERYSVSRGTVRQAFAALRADGIIASRRGARRVVVGGPRVQTFGELLSFSRWARAMGEVPGGQVIAIRRREAKPAEFEELQPTVSSRLPVTAAAAAMACLARNMPSQTTVPAGGDQDADLG